MALIQLFDIQGFHCTNLGSPGMLWSDRPSHHRSKVTVSSDVNFFGGAWAYVHSLISHFFGSVKGMRSRPHPFSSVLPQTTPRPSHLPDLLVTSVSGGRLLLDSDSPF